MDVPEDEIDTENLFLQESFINQTDPASVTFITDNPNHEILKEEESLFLPFAIDQALEIAKMQCKLEVLGTKQALYNYNIRELISPKNTPKSTLALIELCGTDDLKRSLITIASSHLDSSTKIAELVEKTQELKDLFPFHLQMNAAKAGKNVIKFTELHAMTILEKEITRHRIRFAHVATQQASKKLTKEKLKAKAADKTALLVPTEEPTIESLTLKINKMEKLLKGKSKSKSFIKASTKPKNKQQLLAKAKPTARTTPTASSSKSNPSKRSLANINSSLHKISKGLLNQSSSLTIFNRAKPISSSKQKSTETMIWPLPKIVNKGFTNITNDDLSIFHTWLGYGLNFIPYPTKDVSKETILPLVNSMLDRMKWKYFFTYLTEQNSTVHNYNYKLKLPPTPFPDKLMDELLRTKTNLIKREIKNILTINPAKHIIENPIIKQLRDLSITLPSTKFIAADKNLGLVAISTIEYHRLVSLHLLDETTYIDKGPINELPTGHLSSIIDNAFERMLLISRKINLTKQEEKVISDKRVKLPSFHVIAKIHKTPLSGRPIVGAIDWVTTRFSKLLDIKLAPHLVKYPSILKNNSDLINRWSQQPFDSSTDLLVSLDVTSLYTNIILKDTNFIINKINPLLGTLSTLIMENNYFEYNNKLYHQQEGIAMGTNAAVSIANLYMAELIDNKIMSLPNIRCYSRYIDDICFIYTGNKTTLEKLIIEINSYHPKLKFTSVISNLALDVLDLTFYPKQGKLEYRTYQKPINKYLYIPQFSNHPPASIKGFIKGELIRYSRTNSEYNNCLAIRKHFYKRLLERGYSRTYLNSIFSDKTHRTSSQRLEIDPEFHAIQPLPYIQSTRIKLLREFFKNTDLIPDPFKKIIPVWATTPSLARILLRSKLSKEQSAYLKSMGFS